MLSYAAHRRNRRQLRPATLTAIIGVHAVALGLLATSKMDVGQKLAPVITEIFSVPPEIKETPPPPPPVPQPQPVPAQSHIDTPEVIVPAPPQPGPTIDNTPAPPDSGPIAGPRVDPLPLPPQPLPPQPLPPPTVKVAAVLATPADRLRPPYPEAKRRLEEEAVLRLRLAIDERGRVISVDPVGSADPLFLESARSHLQRFWRYKPATEGGRAVPTTLTITLRFQLDEA
ncbi:TonB family protein [Sphingomonas sp. BN140010]|uniref:TonB family protein n=1 Tax=Sphingomonas arvum TaxID=2992113 RepID=A0ABT3JF47_9SPHN|nr:TonB family protein [Sphingomonas sp. BN140010]MCW3797700.1 TonB family protein [Sphingomonas sp. BN140010]